MKNAGILLMFTLLMIWLSLDDSGDSVFETGLAILFFIAAIFFFVKAKNKNK